MNLYVSTNIQNGCNIIYNIIVAYTIDWWNACRSFLRGAQERLQLKIFLA